MRGRRIAVVTKQESGYAPLAATLRRDPSLEPVHAESASRVRALLDEGVDAVVLDLDTPADEVTTILASAVTRGTGAPVIAVARAADERLARCLRDGADDYVLAPGDLVATVHRTCARRAAERARGQREKRASVGAILGHVAHELNNPLGILLGQTDLLLEMLEDGPLKERAHKVVQATERCARMVKDFLLLARRQPLDRTQVDVARVLQETLGTQAVALADDGITVDVEAEESRSFIAADRRQLQQVILHLVTNAHEAMRPAPHPRKLTCRVTTDPATDTVSIQVRDSGPGVPPGMQARIFEPFVTGTPGARGSGLGLALVQSVVEAHGGSVGLISQPGQGATFTVTLPRRPESSPVQERRAGAEEAGLAATVSPATILLVEDQADVARMLADMLSIDGHRVETADDGRRALGKLDEGAYDLVVTDVRMPGLDGPGLYLEVQRRFPQLRGRVLFCTGETLSLETQILLERLNAPVIAKPFEVNELRRVIHRLLNA